MTFLWLYLGGLAPSWLGAVALEAFSASPLVPRVRRTAVLTLCWPVLVPLALAVYYFGDD